MVTFINPGVWSIVNGQMTLNLDLLYIRQARKKRFTVKNQLHPFQNQLLVIRVPNRWRQGYIQVKKKKSMYKLRKGKGKGTKPRGKARVLESHYVFPMLTFINPGVWSIVDGQMTLNLYLLYIGKT